MIHPPAAGGKTAWGVKQDLVSVAMDQDALAAAKNSQADFDRRESDRLQRLKAMDSSGMALAEERRAQKNSFQMHAMPQGAEDFKKRQAEILKKMQDAKALRKAEKMSRTKVEKPIKKNKKEKKQKKKKKESSSSSSSGSSSSSNSSSSSKASSKAKTQKVEKIEIKPLLSPEEEARRKAEEAEKLKKLSEAKAKERELKRKAKEQLAVFEAESKQKEAAAAAKKESEARSQAKAAEDKKKADAKRKAEELADATKNEEEAKRKKEEQDSRKALFSKKSANVIQEKKNQIAGGFRPKQAVIATQDITIRGNIVILAGTAGTVIGPADTDPVGRVAIDFVKRQDGGKVPMNCVPKEIKRR